MKKILLPTDFSANAYNAIEYALQLFKEEECTFYLLHTFVPGSYIISSVDDGPSNMVIEDIARRNVEERLQEIQSKIAAEHAYPKHTFEVIISFSSLMSEMKSIVKEHGIDLIVMGTQGATGAKEVFLGTNTMDTIRKVKIAVIAVPEGFTYQKPQEILFTTDLKFSMENKYLPLLRWIGTKHIARINALNIYTGRSLEPYQEQVKNQLATYFKDNSYLFHELEYMSVTEAVEHFQIQHKADFLVMINNKHSYFENLLFKPVIKEIVFHTSIPFMVIPSVELMKT